MLVMEETAFNAGKADLIPGSGRSSGEGNGSPFQYSHLENPMDRGAWQATVHGITRVGHNLTTKPSITILGTGQDYSGKTICGSWTKKS